MTAEAEDSKLKTQNSQCLGEGIGGGLTKQLHLGSLFALLRF
jgi:hypothetical protein